MKKYVISMVSALLLFSLAMPVAADGRGFAVIRNKNHRQPIPDVGFSYIDDYNCFYVDKSHGDENPDKVLYLTFDAGYENGNVERILDTLKKENVTGTFFILSNLVAERPDLVRRMIAEGHTVGNHTSKHRDMTQFHTEKEFAAELQKLNDFCKQKIGYDIPKFYRPPEGRITEENLKYLEDLGYKTVLWSFAYADWDNEKQPSREYAIQKIMDNTHNGAILLLHPTSKTNADILGECIRKWKADGYRFGSVYDLQK